MHKLGDLGAKDTENISNKKFSNLGQEVRI